MKDSKRKTVAKDTPRWALVTGARRGIGRAIALELAASGLDVIVNDLPMKTDPQMDSLVQEISRAGRRAVVCPGDISAARDRRAIVASALRTAGGIDLLVNNAGVGPRKRMDILSTTEESFDQVLSVNLKGSFFLSQLVANSMVERRQAGDACPFAIVNISSISAYASSPSRAEYCISKAGVSMMTKLFADRLAEYGINVYEIRPGIIATDMTQGVKEKYDALIEGGITPIRRWGHPEDVAKAVAAVASGAFPFSTGEVINVDGGFHLRKL